MEKAVIDSILESNPRLKPHMHKLEAMQVGAYCMHRSWGFGQIKDFDSDNRRLIIDFEAHPDRKDHAMDPAFCVDKLEILPADHILVRKHLEPEALNELIKSDPVQLVVELIEKSPDMEISGAELERVLKRVVGPSKYTRWWSQVKKQLDKDPRIAVPVRNTDYFVLREKPIQPEEEVLEQFYAVKSPQEKILLAERLYELSDGIESIEKDLPQVLSELAEVLKRVRGLSQAARLHGVWVRNNLARHLHEDVDVLEPSSASIIQETKDLSLLAEELPNRFYKRLLDLISRVYPNPEAYGPIVLGLLKNSSGKLTQECISFILSKDLGTLLKDSLLAWLNEQGLKAPLLHWVLRHRSSARYKDVLSSLNGPQLLQAAFSAIDYEALQGSGNRRIPLADEISNDPDMIVDLLGSAGDQVALDLAQILMINQGFNDLSKRSLMARFIKIFPVVQSVLSGEESGRQSVDTLENSLVVSQKSYEAYKKDYEHLVQVEIPENKEAIAQAREHGDLRENAEYQIAKENQTTLLARKGQMERELQAATVTDFSDAPSDSVSIGSVVDLQAEDSGEVITFTILGAWDSDPENNVLSYKTPIARALLYKKVGDLVSLSLDKSQASWKITALRRFASVKTNV